MLSLEQIRHMPSVHEYYNHHSSAPAMDQKLLNNNLRKVFTISTDHTTFECRCDSSGHPIIRSKSDERQVDYRTLESFLKDFPELSSQNNQVKLAKIANFFLKGELFSLIENPQEYIDQYKRDVETEGELFELPPNAITRHGVFNVEEIQLPRLEDGHFIFYVSANIPYRVTFPIPFSADCHPKYELLPFE